MKKEFVEPKLKRIELNLSENIADSGIGNLMGYYFNTDIFCTIQDTNFNLGYIYSGSVTAAQVANCRMSTRVRIGGGVVVPDEKVTPYLRM